VIAKISGTLTGISDGQTVLLQREGFCYEILVPAAAIEELANRVGQGVTLHTVHYLEGSVSGANLFPRLIGFLAGQDKEFFGHFIRVKGVGIRKALRAFAAPAGTIAAAIEQEDVGFLTRLPEIGKRTAAQLIAELKGKLGGFVSADAERGGVVGPLPEYQATALEILLNLGEKRNEALELIGKAASRHPEIEDSGQLIEVVYRIKTTGGI